MVSVRKDSRKFLLITNIACFRLIIRTDKFEDNFDFGLMNFDEPGKIMSKRKYFPFLINDF